MTATASAVRFLSEEYLAELGNLGPGDQPPIAHVNIRLQFHATETPDGAADYYVLIEQGICIRAGRGLLANSELAIRASYGDLADFHSGELHAASAFVTGQFAVTGDKAKLLELMLVLQTGRYHQFTADLWDRATR